MDWGRGPVFDAARAGHKKSAPSFKEGALWLFAFEAQRKSARPVTAWDLVQGCPGRGTGYFLSGSSVSALLTQSTRRAMRARL